MIIKNFVEIVGKSKTMDNEKLMQWLEGYGRVIKLQVYLIERLTDNTKNLIIYTLHVWVFDVHSNHTKNMGCCCVLIIIIGG